ncbi:hypothetical protein AB0L74_02860 [Streptomyces sp. NPDC052020]|uniref:hypothetical protein n=1 Tax=Streptomyces sp. NPDC052020 TaxID=3155677 RepID=UPI00342D338D
MPTERIGAATGHPHAEATSTQRDAKFQLIANADQVTHIVCCRDVSWQTTFCGISGADSINPAAEVFCTMCLEAMEAMSPGCVSALVKVCPVDNLRCPDEHDVLLRSARETDPIA